MPVCLKCGYELVFGPAGCACTQAARRQREMEEAARIGENLVKKLEEARRSTSKEVKEYSEEEARAQIRGLREDLEARRNEIRHQEDLLAADWKALQRRCKHPKLRKYSAMGELGDICDDCGYQT